MLEIDKMIVIHTFVAMLVLSGVSGVDYTPELTEYIFYPLLPFLNQLNVIDGFPVTNATTTMPTMNRLPTKDQMVYYNYYAAVNYYYDLENLTCYYCSKIKPDITNHTGNFGLDIDLKNRTKDSFPFFSFI